MANRISASEKPVHKIFSADYIYFIPPYQRPYSWTEEEAIALLHDLTDAMGNSEVPVKDLSEYFLGSIVLIKEDRVPEAQVVDGQQRLTTLTILFSCLREFLSDSYKVSIDKLIYDKADALSGTKDSYRLNLRNRDEDFFRSNIQRGDLEVKLKKLNLAELSDSQRSLVLNAKAFMHEFNSMDSELLEKLATYISLKCTLVVVTSTDQDSAFRTFSVMNDRGKDLSNSDILKAEIIGSIQDDSEMRLYTDKWEDIELSLGRDHFESLFSYIRMIELKTKAKGSILKEFRNSIKPSANPKNFIDNKILPYAESFLTIKNTDYKSEDSASTVNSLLRWLNRLDNNFNWIPPTILFLSLNKSNEAILVKFLQHMERLSIGLTILRFDIDKRITRYSKILSAIESNDDLYSEGSSMLLTQEEQNAVVLKLNGNIYLESKTRLLILLKLDDSLSSGGATYDNQKTTIEHVLPQNPDIDSEWVKLWPSEDIRKKFVHKLGNLVILDRGKNSSASNYDFKKKKVSYFSKNGVSPFQLTTTVINEDKWTQEVVEKRQEKFVELLCSSWGISSSIPTYFKFLDKTFEFNEADQYWANIDSEEVDCGIYLINSKTWVSPSEWDGNTIICVCDKDSDYAELLSKVSYFSTVSSIIYYPSVFQIKGEKFLRGNSSWDSEKCTIALYKNGKRQKALISTYDEIYIETDEKKLDENEIRRYLQKNTFFANFSIPLLPDLEASEALALVGKIEDEYSRTGVKFYKLKTGDIFSLKRSKYYPDESNFWYGVSPDTLQKYRDENTAFIVFSIGSDGVIKVPMELLEEYILHTKTSSHSDGSIKHHHLFIKKVKGKFCLYINSTKSKWDVMQYFIARK